MERISLSNGFISVIVDPAAGGRIARITYADTDLLIGREHENVADDDLGWGCYPMAPFAGRLRDATFRWNDKPWSTHKNHGPHAIHGTTVARPWNVVNVDSKSVQLNISLDDGTGTLWPFGGSCTHTVTIGEHADERSSVTCMLSVDDTTPGSPFQLGWHPWFAKPVHAEFSFAHMYVRDSKGITTPSRIAPKVRPWDDCFAGARVNPRLCISDIDIELRSNLSHWVIFDELPYATCVEPQSGPPNEFNFSEDEKAALGLQSLRHDGDRNTAEFTMLFNHPT